MLQEEKAVKKTEEGMVKVFPNQKMKVDCLLI